MVPLAFVLMAMVSGESQVGVQAAYVPAKGGAAAGVAVTFSPQDPDLRVNEEPAPRLKLDGGQKVLLAAAPPPPAGEKAKAGEIRYLDTALPVVFPVKLGPAAAKGEHSVKGAVTYFYCSKREGWCRKGTADVEVPVRID